MLGQVQNWAAINSGSGNLDGLATTAALLADAFSALPGEVTLVEPEPVDRVLSDGTVTTVTHGRHLLMTVRPECRAQLLFTGHMDTVFPADHHFQTLRWLDDGALNGPGVADMKGGIAASMLAFALLAWWHHRRHPGSLPSVTGAPRPVVLGVCAPPP